MGAPIQGQLDVQRPGSVVVGGRRVAQIPSVRAAGLEGAAERLLEEVTKAAVGALRGGDPQLVRALQWSGLEGVQNILARREFDEQVEQLVLRFTDPLKAALRDLENAQKARLEEAKRLGADLVDLERLNALERKEVIERFGRQANSALEQLLIRETASAAAPIPIEQALANAQQRFNQLIGGDDPAATARAADNLLDLLRERFASSAEFFSRRQAVLDPIRNLLPGFQGGGSFSIPGGGFDNVVPLFRASSGETVTVTRGNGELVSAMQAVGGEITETNRFQRRILGQVENLNQKQDRLTQRLGEIELRLNVAR